MEGTRFVVPHLSFNMREMPANFDFRKRAEQEMVKEGFRPFFPPEVLAQTDSLTPPSPRGQDLRDLYWSSIDNTESRDLDQVEVAEQLSNGDIRVRVGIADVDVLARLGSGINQHAGFNCMTVYTGGPAFSMLPERLSQDLTSLCEGSDRLAIVIEFVVAQNGDMHSGSINYGTLRNKARLTYDQVQRFFKSEGQEAFSPELASQLRLQHEAALRLAEFRRQSGALSFGGVEQVPIIVNNHVKGMEEVDHNGARDLIESFMVAANVTVARFLRERGSMSVRRVVREPKRWDRIQAMATACGTSLPAQPDPRALSEFLVQRKKADPEHFPELSLAILKSLGPGEYIVEHPGFEREGHFGLAVQDYSHATAPNRRYADLTQQRLIKAALFEQPSPFSEVELSELAAHCTERESAARHVERFMKKVAAALLLGPQVGEKFDAIVTGVAQKGTFVRLLKVPAEGRLIHGERGLDVGDRVGVRLVSVNPDRGFVDFEPVH